jgi:hypothetical protein
VDFGAVRWWSSVAWSLGPPTATCAQQVAAWRGDWMGEDISCVITHFGASVQSNYPEHPV